LNRTPLVWLPERPIREKRLLAAAPAGVQNVDALSLLDLCSSAPGGLNHFLCFSLDHLEHITCEFVRFYSEHRPRQSLGNRTPPEASKPPARRPTTKPRQIGRVRCRKFLGGLLRHYYCAVA